MKEQLMKYADLILQKGVNLQPGQQVILRAPIEAREFVHAIYERAYELESGTVHVLYNDELLQPIYFQKASDEVIEHFPNYRREMMIELAAEGACIISIYAQDPELLKNCDPKRIATASKVSAENMKDFSKLITTGKMRWNVVSVPTPSWARKVFPDVTVEEAVDKLWDDIFKITRADQVDPLEAWDNHSKNLFEKRDFLNEANFKKLIYKAPGTNLEVDLPEGHLWVAGPKTDEKDIMFTPNIPTEEVFTMPHKLGVNGTLASTMPLNYNGVLINDIELTFKDGKVVAYNASAGLEALKNLIETDEGSHYLGEVALVPVDSPISNLNTLYYNTLYDENASCHFAFGRAYQYTMKNGTTMTDEEFEAVGGNTSLTHVDFMVGSEKLDIDGVKEDGTIVPVFRKGNWV
jgi:aminopeptidase